MDDAEPVPRPASPTYRARLTQPSGGGATPRSIRSTLSSVTISTGGARSSLATGEPRRLESSTDVASTRAVGPKDLTLGLPRIEAPEQLHDKHVHLLRWGQGAIH